MPPLPQHPLGDGHPLRLDGPRPDRRGGRPLPLGLLPAPALTARLEISCPKCRSAVRAEAAPASDLVCPRCGGKVALRASSVAASGGVGACLACGCGDLYRQKDFPRKIGLGVVAAAALLVFVAAGSPSLPLWAIYAPLLAAAALDAALYLALPEVVVCYRCRAKHRGFAREPRPEPFDPAVHDRYAFGSATQEGSRREDR